MTVFSGVPALFPGLGNPYHVPARVLAMHASYLVHFASLFRVLISIAALDCELC